MAHPYPKHLDNFDYLGKYHYFLTFETFEKASLFTSADNVALVRTQILRAGTVNGMAVVTYCYMPDHLHLLVKGQHDAADARAFIKSAKQYSGYYFARARRARLWRRYGYERVVRDDFERLSVIAYILANPVRAGLVTHPADYPFLGSEICTLSELIEQLPDSLRSWDVAGRRVRCGGTAVVSSLSREVERMDLQALLDSRMDAWNRRDPVALATSYADDAVVSSPMFPHAEGRKAIELSFVSLFRVFPDWEITCEPACVSGSRAIQPCTIRATHRGDFMGIPGSGRRVEFDCVLIFDFADGLIARERRIYDFTGMLIQLGVLRGKPAV